MPLWWLSFTDPQRPKGERFLGVALVETEEIADLREATKAAIQKAWATGCNPGGEVQTGTLMLDRYDNAMRVRLARAPKHVLLSKEELEHYDLI